MQYHAPDTSSFAVLPPVPTTGLTTSDVGALTVRVHDMMVEALREISVPASSSSADIATTAPAETTQEAKQEPLAQILPSVTEAGPDATLPESRSESRASQATSLSEDFSSPSSSRHGLDGSEAGVDTEEDEGMVLVGRPSL